jgi:phospholipid-binding lipoprotein MlaA
MSLPRIVLLVSVLGTSGIGFSYAADKNLSVDDFAMDANASQPDAVKDPFERINRKVFAFNNYLDQHALLPAARFYQKVVPSPVNTGISNFFTNLTEPWTAVNQLLQGKPLESVRSISRFTVNTVTSLGLADPAYITLKMPRAREDLGQTLGVWGVGSGPFLMLPFRGPSTLRDTGAMFVDQWAAPQRYIDSGEAYFGLITLQTIDARADLIGVESLVNGDQYPLLRDVYLQRRQFQIQDGKVPESSNPPIDEGFGDESFGDAMTTPAEPTPSAPTEQGTESIPSASDSLLSPVPTQS